MPFIEIPLGDSGEDELVPEGTYDLRVAKFDSTKTTTEGNPKLYAMIVIEDSEHPDAAPIHLNMAIPDKDHQYRKLMLTSISRFFQGFGIDYEDGGFNDEDIEGATASLFVAQVEDFRDSDNMVNEVRFPRLANDVGKKK